MWKLPEWLASAPAGERSVRDGLAVAAGVGAALQRAGVGIDADSVPTPNGPREWLQQPNVAACVAEALFLGERVWKKYDLRAWVIMANHVHVLLSPSVELSKVTKSIKSYSARQANEVLGRTGEPFWQDESYDHWVRDDEEMNRIIRYIEWNPVKAGLVGRIEDWHWSSASVWAGHRPAPRGAGR